MVQINLFPDRVLFELTSSDVSYNLGLAQNALGCSHSIMIGQAAIIGGGFQLLAALREIGYSTIIVNASMTGSIQDIEHILRGIYEEQICDAVTVFGFQTHRMMQKIQQINYRLAEQTPGYRVKILASFPRSDISYDAESVQMAVSACKYLDGIVASHKFISDHDTGKIPVCAYSPYAMNDVHSTDTDGRSELVQFIRQFPHVVFAGNKILNSLTSFDVFERFLEDNWLGSYAYE